MATIRDILVASTTDEITPEAGIMVGHALALDYKTVVVGKDQQRRSAMISNALIAGLTSSGTNVIDVGVVPEPVLATVAGLGECAVYATGQYARSESGGFHLMNPDGSPFGPEQYRRLERVFTNTDALPEPDGVGTVKTYHNAINDYYNKILSSMSRDASGSIVLNCNCGTAGMIAPQLISDLGGEVISINAQIDNDFNTDKGWDFDIELRNVKTFIESDPGCIGMSVSCHGAFLVAVDEDGESLSDEETLALIAMYSKVSSMVVPLDIPLLVCDAVLGKIDAGVVTPWTTDDDPVVTKTERSAHVICDVLSKTESDIGFYNGRIIYRHVSLASDAIFTAALLTQIAGSNSIKKIREKFPKYHKRTWVATFDSSRDELSAAIEETLKTMKFSDVSRGNGWRVDMEEGWFALLLPDNDEKQLEVIVEARDKAYMVSLVEVVENFEKKCGISQ